MQPTMKRRLTCILAADAVGYSKMMGEDEPGTLRVLAAHRAVIDGIIAFHEGRIVTTAGDSVLAEFGSVVEAVRCAVEIQDALRTRNDALPEDRRLHFRVGVNLGDVVVKGDDLLGDGVNVAARLESIAEPGEVCIASSVYDQITGKLDLRFVDIGEQQLKNISRPVRVYKIASGGAPARAPARSATTASGPWKWIAAGFGTAAAVAVAVAWQAGWLDSRSSRDNAAKLAEAQVAAANEEAKAQLAKTAEQAQALADEAKRHAEAEAELTRARAKAEADATRAKAELEAASVRAKAQAEAAAVRVQAEKTRAEPPKAAPAPAVVASAPSPAPSAANAYDGAWLVSRALAKFEEAPASSDIASIRVSDGLFVIEYGAPGSVPYSRVSGHPGSDGTLILTGKGVSGMKSYYGKWYDIRFEGRCSAVRCELTGKYGTRPGTITLAKLGG